MHNLQRFLVDYDIAMLRAVAEKRDVDLISNRQTEAADQLAAALLDPLSVRVARAHLSDAARGALSEVLARGGRMRAPHFDRRFGRIRPSGPGRLEREAPWREPANPSEELLYLGLIYRGFYNDAGGPGEFVFVPDDLLPLLPQSDEGAPVFAIETVDRIGTGQPAADAGKALVDDLFAYLVFLQTHDVQPYADGRLGRRDSAALRRRLDDGDEQRLIYLRHLAQQSGFVVLRDKYLRLETSPVKRWLTLPLQNQVSALQATWRDDPTWNELWYVPSLECDPKTHWHQQHEPMAPRQALLSLMARCPLDAWWSLPSFIAAVKETHPDFQRPDGDYGSWYIRERATGEYLSGFESWERVEGAFIAYILSSPLIWLGVVETREQEGCVACRLTDSGARLLNLLPAEPAAAPPQTIHLRSDLTITANPSASLYTRFQLERFAEIDASAPLRYQLTVQSIGQALNRGVEIDQILAFLQQASQAALPTRVAGQLRLWAGRFGQVELEQVALLRVKHERVLKELAVLPETKSLISTIVAPTVALVRERDLPRLRKQLRVLGYLPPGPDRPGGDSAERG